MRWLRTQGDDDGPIQIGPSSDDTMSDMCTSVLMVFMDIN